MSKSLALEVHRLWSGAADGAILVWPFYEAPECLRELSTNGGDEDWLALVPPRLAERTIWWIENPCGGFGCCGTQEHRMPDGSVVYIGSHA